MPRFDARIAVGEETYHVIGEFKDQLVDFPGAVAQAVEAKMVQEIGPMKSAEDLGVPYDVVSKPFVVGVKNKPQPEPKPAPKKAEPKGDK